jgi:hypothetical protein
MYIRRSEIIITKKSIVFVCVRIENNNNRANQNFEYIFIYFVFIFDSIVFKVFFLISLIEIKIGPFFNSILISCLLLFQVENKQCIIIYMIYSFIYCFD